MTPAVEFSHKVTVEPWPEDGIVVELTATAAERVALKARFDLVDLGALSASISIEKQMTELVLTGTIEAVVTQTCVVTLKPVTSSLNVSFERHYRKQETHERISTAGSDLSEIEDDIDIEILDDEEIDIGGVVAEEFYLALPPYPRSDDADRFLDELNVRNGSTTADRTTNPFEKLRQN